MGTEDGSHEAQNTRTLSNVSHGYHAGRPSDATKSHSSQELTMTLESRMR